MSVAIFVNPGSGDAREYGRTSLRDAWKNVRQFRRELGADVAIIRTAKQAREDEDGRYLFRLERVVAGRKRPAFCEVMMPGLPLKQVRYRCDTTDNAWHFPRLLVGPYGSSWLWPFALNSVACDLKLPEVSR